MIDSNANIRVKSIDGLTGYHLKMIALITMLIDHIAAVLIWRVYVASYAISGRVQLATIGDRVVYWVAQNQEAVFNVYQMMRYIGRMAFPIYCFLLVEGFLHTKSVANYAKRLFIFALISEIPFDLALSGTWWDMGYSNVFFTLVIGLLLIWALSYIEKFYEFWQEKKWDDFAGKLICGIAGGFVAIVLGGVAENILMTDYGMAGVFAIAVLYLTRKTKEIGFVLAVMVLSVMTSSTEILALLMLLPLMKYNGQKGKGTKYVFYAFYPVHLFVLALICMAFGV